MNYGDFEDFMVGALIAGALFGVYFGVGFTKETASISDLRHVAAGAGAVIACTWGRKQYKQTQQPVFDVIIESLKFGVVSALAFAVGCIPMVSVLMNLMGTGN